MDSVLSFYRQERCGDKCLARGLPQTEWLFPYSDYFAVTNTEDSSEEGAHVGQIIKTFQRFRFFPPLLV